MVLFVRMWKGDYTNFVYICTLIKLVVECGLVNNMWGLSQGRLRGEQDCCESRIDGRAGKLEREALNNRRSARNRRWEKGKESIN